MSLCTKVFVITGGVFFKLAVETVSVEGLHTSNSLILIPWDKRSKRSIKTWLPFYFQHLFVPAYSHPCPSSNLLDSSRLLNSSSLVDLSNLLNLSGLLSSFGEGGLGYSSMVSPYVTPV